MPSSVILCCWSHESKGGYYSIAVGVFFFAGRNIGKEAPHRTQVGCFYAFSSLPTESHHGRAAAAFCVHLVVVVVVVVVSGEWVPRSLARNGPRDLLQNGDLVFALLLLEYFVLYGGGYTLL